MKPWPSGPRRCQRRSRDGLYRCQSEHIRSSPVDYNEERTHMLDKPWWCRIRDRAPHWRAKAEGLAGCRAGEPPRCIIKMGVHGAGGRSYPVSVDFADLAIALGRLEWVHPDGVRLKMVADLWIGSCTLEDIGSKLARPATRETASRLLNAAFRWVCSAEGGGFVEPGA